MFRDRRETPHITLYYATREHAEQAWHGIMHKIAPLLGPLRASVVRPTRPDLPPTISFCPILYAFTIWLSLLPVVCQAVVGSEEDRAKREYTLNMSKRALVDLCQQEAAKFLVAQRHELAIPGAVQAISFLKDLHGDGSMELVPLTCSWEANLGLGRFQQAEEFLSLANWSVPKTQIAGMQSGPTAPNFGKLYSAQGKLDE